MSIPSEINRIKANVAETYSVLEGAGATMPSAQNTDNLAETAASISSVLYTAQSLTEAQQEQARQNIKAANEANSIFYVVGTGSTAGTWLGTHPDIKAYYDGLTIAYKIAIAGASTTTLNINSLGAKTVRRATSSLTTQLGVGTVVHLTYTTISGTGYWVWANYDSGNTKVTQAQSSTATGKYGVLLSYYTQDKTTTTAQTVRRDNNFWYQPSSGTLNVQKVVGTLSGDIENCPTVDALSERVDQSAAHTDACFSVLEPLEILVPGININHGNYVHQHIKSDGSIGTESWGDPTQWFVSADYIPVTGGRQICQYHAAAAWEEDQNGYAILDIVQYNSAKQVLSVGRLNSITVLNNYSWFTLDDNAAFIKIGYTNWNGGISTPLSDIKIAVYYKEDARTEFVEYGVGAEFTYGVTGSNVVLTAPNGNKYKLTVSNTGALSTTAI